MSRGSGRRVISREEKRLQKEKEKRIREANRMLIPVPKNTITSMNLLSFDPMGTFCFEGNRWVRVYKVVEDSKAEIALGELARNLKANVRFTKEIFAGGEERMYITLTEQSETYEEVRTLFSEDEEKISLKINMHVCNIDEVMALVIGDDTKHFSYASMVRGRRDWKKECMEEVAESDSGFKIQKMTGECLFVMQYPAELKTDIVERLKLLKCRVLVALDIDSIDVADQIDFSRALEQKYNRHGMANCEFMNASCQIVFFCDSEDAKGIIEKTIISILSAEGFIITPSIGAQKKVAESVLSYGLLSNSVMRNVDTKVLDEIRLLGGQTNGND